MYLISLSLKVDTIVELIVVDWLTQKLISQACITRFFMDKRFIKSVKSEQNFSLKYLKTELT